MCRARERAFGRIIGGLDEPQGAVSEVLMPQTKMLLKRLHLHEPALMFKGRGQLAFTAMNAITRRIAKLL
jgi:hypothetical protein